MKYLIPCRMETNDYGDVEFFRFFDTKKEEVVHIEPDTVVSLLDCIYTLGHSKLSSVDDLINYVLMADFSDTDEFDAVAYCVCRNEEDCFLLFLPKEERCVFLSRKSYLIDSYCKKSKKLNDLFDGMDWEDYISLDIDITYPNLDHPFLKIYKYCGTGVFIGDKLLNMSGDTLLLGEELVYLTDIENTKKGISNYSNIKTVVFHKNTKAINHSVFRARVLSTVRTIMCSKKTEHFGYIQNVKVEYYD